jgi:hypothetical protein
MTQLQFFLSENVLPQLAAGFIHITREKPDDPIEYLQSFLRQAGEKAELIAIEKAREKFFNALSNAEQ